MKDPDQSSLSNSKMNRQIIMTRRKVCSQLAGGTAALAFGFRFASAANEQVATFRLRYILASSLYGTLPLDVILPEVHKTGTDVIDIWPLKHGNQREQVDAMGHERFAALLKQYDVKLGCLTRYDLGPFKLESEIERVAGLIEISGWFLSATPPDSGT